MFCFRCTHHTSMNLKEVLRWKLEKFTLFTLFLVGWNLKNLYKHVMSIVFCWHFKQEKSIFLKASFSQNKKWLCVKKLCVQHFATSKNFSFKELYLFSEKSFCKSNRKLFSCVCIAWYKHSRGWENSWQLCKPLTLSPVYIYLSWTSLIFISGYANTENVFYCLSGTCCSYQYYWRQ